MQDHIIPSAIGGTGVTLTCRACNNEQGSRLDGHLVRMIRALDGLAGDRARQFKGTVTVEDVQLPMKLEWRKGEDANVISILGGTAATLRSFQDAAHLLADGNEIQITFTLHLSNWATTAYLAKPGRSLANCWRAVCPRSLARSCRS